MKRRSFIATVAAGAAALVARIKPPLLVDQIKPPAPSITIHDMATAIVFRYARLSPIQQSIARNLYAQQLKALEVNEPERLLNSISVCCQIERYRAVAS